MQKYKFVMREIGNVAGMWKSSDLEAYLEENIAKEGYELFSSHISDIHIENTYVGFRINLVFVKNGDGIAPKGKSRE